MAAEYIETLECSGDKEGGPVRYFNSTLVAIELLFDASASDRDALEQLRQMAEGLVSVAGGWEHKEVSRNRERETGRVRYLNDCYGALERLYDASLTDPATMARFASEAENAVMSAGD